MATRTFWI